MKTKGIVSLALFLFSILILYIFSFGFILYKAPTSNLENIGSIIKKDENISVISKDSVVNKTNPVPAPVVAPTPAPSAPVVVNYGTRTAVS